MVCTLDCHQWFHANLVEFSLVLLVTNQLQVLFYIVAKQYFKEQMQFDIFKLEIDRKYTKMDK